MKSKRRRVRRNEVADTTNGESLFDDEPLFDDEDDNDDDDDWLPGYVSRYEIE